MIKLRQWQAECIDLALGKYVSGVSHFLALATPGAGKTIMAAELAKRMLEQDLIDIVLCFSPSSIVCTDFSDTLEKVIGDRFDGLLGARGQSLTYQGMRFLNDNFWKLFSVYRVFVIFDEIHHCAGSCVENSNAWGEQIILNVQNKAKHTLALSGTPWRSDTSPIVLSQYCDSSNSIHCDYVYGLAEAIRDNVCRLPRITAIDNYEISIFDENEHKFFSSFKDLLTHSSFPYQNVIENESVIRQILEVGNMQLDSLRKKDPVAGGLVVACSVEHAYQILEIMRRDLNEDATIVTYMADAPSKLIYRYRGCSSKWVISIGMISEGTNIPRLQICCHLSNIKTELHFRQILGRILRWTDSANKYGYLYMPAEPKLVEYAHRVALDIPEESRVVRLETLKSGFSHDNTSRKNNLSNSMTKSRQLNVGENAFNEGLQPKVEGILERNALSDSYEKMMNIFGRFKQEVIELDY